jgi:hypothetical protein
MDDNTEIFVRIIELERQMTILQAHVVNIMQLIEMLAARLGELVPETPETPDTDSGAYL